MMPYDVLGLLGCSFLAYVIDFLLVCTNHLTVVGFKLSGHFKFFFDIINVRVTILDAKGLIK